jgi:POT family proton-dependent oligopeptide transporter
MSANSVVDDPLKKEFLGHPIGLYVLFFTEMWERFSYYGMRAIFILYMVNYLSMGDSQAGNIYGDYTGLVYLTPLLGGFLSDRFLGLQRAIIIGALMMAAGEFFLSYHAIPGPGGGAEAVGSLGIFWVGLLLLILGNGFFKPNISTIVGQLYDADDNRRDAACTIFYMGINLGAFFSPLVCGYLGQKIGWQYGFGAAGVGMLIGTLTFLLGRRWLGDRGLRPAGHAEGGATHTESPLRSGEKRALSVVAVMGLLVAGWFAIRGFGETQSLLDAFRASMWPLIFFICIGMYVYLFGRCTAAEIKKVNVIFVLGIFVMFFWAAFEQAGSSMTLFADRNTNNSIMGFDYPSSWFQSMNPIFIIALAPVFSMIWTYLARRRREPSTPMKMTVGIGFNVLAFAFIMPGAIMATGGSLVSPVWLTGLYFLQTCGELCLSPIGLSMVTKLAPIRYGALLMGVWFLANAWANKLAGSAAGYLEVLGPRDLFGAVGGILAAVTLILLFCVPWLRRQMGDVH